MLDFLARKDTVPVELPFRRSPCEAPVLREEIASSRLSLKVEIDQFFLKEERQEGPVIQVSDSEDKPDRFSGVCPSGLVIACIDNSSKEEKEEMALNRKKGLKELLVDRAKGPAQKDTSRSQPLLTLPPFSFHIKPAPYPQPEKEKEGV